MVSSNAKTVAAYLDELPPERRAVISKVRAVIRKHLPKGYVEMMLYGMISYVVPLSIEPDTYNGQPLWYAALAAQKSAYSVYLMGVYGSKEVRGWFEKEYAKTGKRLDMGKSCVRFKSLDDLPLPLIGKAIAKVPLSKYRALANAARGA